MERTELKRRKPMKKVNRKRKAKTDARNFGERGGAIRRYACLVFSACLKHGSVAERGWTVERSCQGDVQACHAIARGMGGAKGDRRTLVPLCHGHHAEAGERGTSQRAAFEDRYGLDLQAEAERIAGELDARGLA